MVKKNKNSIRINKRSIHIFLAIFWLIDGLMQLKSKMFTANFANKVIAPNAMGQPLIISDTIHLFVKLFLLNPELFNILIILIQLSIAILIFLKRSTNIGLWLSVFWGLFVWFVGEGLGGILSGHASFLSGSPGAAIIYVTLALVSLNRKNEGSNFPSPSFWLAYIWCAVWVGAALFQLFPGQNNIASIVVMLEHNAYSAPSWLAIIDLHLSHLMAYLGHSSLRSNGMYMSSINSVAKVKQSYSGYWLILAISLLELFVGMGIFFKNSIRKAALFSGIVFSFLIWIIIQNAGGYYLALSTDLNTGPLIIFMGLCVLSINDINQGFEMAYLKVQRLLT